MVISHVAVECNRSPSGEVGVKFGAALEYRNRAPASLSEDLATVFPSWPMTWRADVETTTHVHE